MFAVVRNRRPEVLLRLCGIWVLIYLMAYNTRNKAAICSINIGLVAVPGGMALQLQVLDVGNSLFKAHLKQQCC
jgi:hypothetical protein